MGKVAEFEHQISKIARGLSDSHWNLLGVPTGFSKSTVELILKASEN